MSTLLIGSANTEDVIILDNFPIENGKQRFTKVLRFEDRHALNRFKGFGGSAVNWSVWHKAVGGNPLLICPLGTDNRGKQVREELRKEGIMIFESSELAFADGVGLEGLGGHESNVTAHSYIWVDERKWTRTVMGTPSEQGAAPRWARSLLRVVRDTLEQTTIVSAMIGNIAAESQERRYTPQIIDAIKESNPDAFIYANFGKSQYSCPFDTWDTSLRNVDCFQFSLNEAKDFVIAGESRVTSRPPLDEVLAWFHSKRLNVIITLGRGGAVSVFGEHSSEVCLTWSRNLRRDIVDPTGAGDAFGAGFVACVNRFIRAGRPPLEDKDDRLLALGTGSVFGALACHGYGGVGGCFPPLEAQVGDPPTMRLTQCFALDDGNDLLYALDRD